MDINKIYSELDSLPYTEIEGFLKKNIDEAIASSLFEIQIPLINEMIGFLRDTTQFDKGAQYKQLLLDSLIHYGQQDTMNQATSMLNIANFDRAAGNYSESIDEYRVCESIYEKLLPKGDYLWAGLYNNESLLYQMMGDNLAAIGALSKALSIVDKLPDRRIEVATTYTNIAQSLAALGQMEEAKENVTEALKIFAEGNNEDYHYSAAAAVMGIIAYDSGDYREAARYYDEAATMVKRIMGENDNYKLLISNRDAMLNMLGEDSSVEKQDAASFQNNSEKGLTICRKYYEEYGIPMIKNSFAKYENKIAVGLFLEGSDCMGFDDELSRDHDWGPGFMLLVTRATYGDIGARLEKAYEELPDEYLGYKRNSTKEASGRTGVIIIEDLIDRYLKNAIVIDNGIRKIDKSKLGYVEEYILAQFVNGEIWTDGEGIISGIRSEIASYYDDETLIKKLAVSLIKMGQTGQYNLPRILKREDYVTAGIYLGEYYTNTLQTLFLINRKYAPYEKWLFRAAKDLPIHPEIADCLCAIADMDIKDERIPMTIEIIAQIVLSALKEIGLVANDYDNWYLERLGKDILSGNMSETVNNTIDKSELVDKIVRLEWEAFDKVENEGGRASCQDNWTTFEIMRKSQYLEWTIEMLESFIYDFELANSRGWNLITEKYGRMEKSTAPEEYAKIEAALPKHTEAQDAIIEQIVAIQVGMMEEVAGKYPNMATNARSIHTSEDTPYNTSYETYLRGELGTYSENTLALYGRYIAELASRGENLSYNILNNTAKMYGYESADACELRLSQTN